MEIWEFINRIREQRSLDKVDLYTRLGVTQPTFLKWERDGKLSFENYIKVCKILNIDPRAYFDEIGGENILRAVSEPFQALKPGQKDQESEILRQNSQLIEIINKLVSKQKV